MKKPVKKNPKGERPSWDKYFIGIVDAVGSRATCDRGGSGCVITINNRILSTGYLGSVSGLPHCDEVGHGSDDETSCTRTIHAEHNAITQALSFGISLAGGTMYLSVSPCEACKKLATTMGIKKIITKKDI